MGIKLLDCTVRDGGYINDWNFGERTIKDIFNQLVKARVDIIEVGFLRNDPYDPNCSKYNNVEQIKRMLPKDRGQSEFVAMALHNLYDISQLEPYDGTGISGIRVTFHDYDIDEGLEFCKKVIEKGYQCYCQPINIMGYSDEAIIGIVKKVNEIKPDGFAIVDTFGSMMKEDLYRICMVVSNNLDKDITLGVHLHENLSQSYSLAQEFMNLCPYGRNMIVDASLSGMGRVPGNLCIELIAEYMNREKGKNYDLDPILDAIDDHILAIKEKHPWGYSAPYSISAKYNLHRNYAEDLVNRGTLKARDINYILGQIVPEKKTAFDKKYIDQLFYEYQANRIDDAEDMQKLAEIFAGKTALIMAPGNTIITHREKIDAYIEKEKPVAICVNFNSEELPHEYCFFTNTKRLEKAKRNQAKVIVTSNLLREDKGHDYAINYNSLASTEKMGDNTVIMLIKLMRMLNVAKIVLAGCDGYASGKKNYFDDFLASSHKATNEHNREMAAQLKQLGLGMEIEFLTPSHYTEME